MTWVNARQGKCKKRCRKLRKCHGFQLGNDLTSRYCIRASSTRYATNTIVKHVELISDVGPGYHCYLAFEIGEAFCTSTLALQTHFSH